MKTPLGKIILFLLFVVIVEPVKAQDKIIQIKDETIFVRILEKENLIEIKYIKINRNLIYDRLKFSHKGPSHKIKIKAKKTKKSWGYKYYIGEEIDDGTGIILNIKIINVGNSEYTANIKLSIIDEDLSLDYWPQQVPVLILLK